MTDREKLLARVREALSVESQDGLHPKGSSAAIGNARDWLPATGDSIEERLERFRKNAEALRAQFHFLNHQHELEGILRNIRVAEHWTKIATHRGRLTDLAADALAMPATLRTDSPYDPNELDRCDAGITECDALVAQTGSVLLTNRSVGGRALSVLPPHHVVLARQEQLLRDLPDAFALLRKKYDGNYPSMISFVTGPSRTADIERILVLGAHGPRKLTIICW